MANESNLIPIRSKDEARELGRRGGVASGVVRREKSKMRQILSEALLLPSENIGNNKQAIAMALVNRALTGDVRAFETIMKFVGEMPKEREQTETDDEIEANPLGMEFYNC